MNFQLRPAQRDGVDFLLKHPNCGLFFDCGLGKTLTVLKSLDERPDMMLPALIVAPARVARNVWPAEIEKWYGGRFSYAVAGRSAMARKLKDLPDITIVTPQSLDGLLGWCEHNRRMPWTTIVSDESTFFKNWESKRWANMKILCRNAFRVALLTATPVSGRGLIDIWAQIELWNHNPLGHWDYFSNRWFNFDIYNRARPVMAAEDEINQLINPYVLRRKLDSSEVPELIEVDERLDLPAASLRAYKDLKTELSLQGKIAYTQLRQLANGFQYVNHWSGEQTPIWDNETKLDAVDEIRSSCPGESVLIFCSFTAEIDRLLEKYSQSAMAIRGGTSPATAARAIDYWNRGQLPILIMHPLSGGHGLNLQEGGRRVIWYSLPDSGELYTQAVARVFRSGQAAQSVVVHRLIANDTIDGTIASLLQKKILTETTLLDALNDR